MSLYPDFFGLFCGFKSDLVQVRKGSAWFPVCAGISGRDFLFLSLKKCLLQREQLEPALLDVFIPLYSC